MTRLILRAMVATNKKGKRFAIHLTQWTGKSREPIHPKHLLGENSWYLPMIRPTDHVLDVGCGHGAHALKAATRARMVVGIDRDLAAIRAARAAAAPRSRGAMFLLADVESPLPLPTGGYEVILCLDVLEHVAHRDALLRELRRVLAPHGRLLVCVPNRETPWKQRLQRAGLFAFSDPDHKVEYTLPELRAELARAGFAIRALLPSVSDTPLIGLLDVVGACSLTVYRAVTAWRRRSATRHPERAAGFYAVCELAETVP